MDVNSRDAIAIDFGPRRLRALQASDVRGALRIRRSLIEDLPAGLGLQDAAALGQWIGSQLHAAGFSRAKAVIAVGREHVGLKRLTLPTTVAAELPDMTRLAMQRELPFDADSAVIDFIPVERGESSTTVLAVAVPRAVLDMATAVAQAAGLNVARITLRIMGAAALHRTLELEPDQSSGLADHESELAGQDARAVERSAVLAIDVLGDSIELCVMSNGAIQFSRAADVPVPQDQLAIADAVVTETRRTWMSFQSAGGSVAMKSALIMGDQRVSAYAAEPVSQMLDIPIHVLEAHPRVDAAGHELDRFWSLAGLLLEPLLGGEVIDFAHPRKAPDLNARKRQRRLAAAGIAIVAVLGAWTMARQQLNSLQRRASELVQSQKEQVPVIARYWRDNYKLEHLRKWESSTVDWLQHAAYLTTIAPPTDRLVLDKWNGALEFAGVRYDMKSGTWSADQQLTINIDGEARDRETADSFRAALVQSSIYATATPGADAKGGKRMPFAFTYRLRTKSAAPAGAPVTESPGQNPKSESEIHLSASSPPPDQQQP